MLGDGLQEVTSSVPLPKAEPARSQCLLTQVFQQSAMVMTMLPAGSLLQGFVHSAALSASVLSALTTAEQISPEKAHDILKYRLPKKKQKRAMNHDTSLLKV